MTPEQLAVQRVRECIEAVLADLQGLFVDGARLTFIMRLPGHIEADMVITCDDLSEIRELIDRRITDMTSEDSHV